MIAELQCVVLDCPEPRVLAEFYRSLLGGNVDQPDRRWSLDDDWATLHTPTGPVLAFQRARDHVPPKWPDPSRPQQFHLDLAVPDLDRAQEQVLAAGGTLLDGAGGEGGAGGGEGRGWRVYADPAGHPFCLVRD
ncbi:VOC family protein [Streptomyces sp. NPDC056254]|uniref:VOC family protein n=1 Tax=Streptomyces sp. NPDC056254 TaxID=3345763 RepID=UPI0035DF20C6